jgi:hypothetical protein
MSKQVENMGQSMAWAVSSKLATFLLVVPLAVAASCAVEPTSADPGETAGAEEVNAPAASPAAKVDQTGVDTAELDASPGAGTNGVNGFGHLRLSNTNLCVQPSSIDGARLQLRGCTSSTAQNWLLSSLPSTSDYRIFNQASGLCINNASEPTQNGGNVTLGECNIFGTSRPVSNAQWHPSSTAGLASFQSKIIGSSGFCIDVPGGNAFDGAMLQMYSCNGTPAQLFIIE